MEVFSLRAVHTEAKSVVGLDGRAKHGAWRFVQEDPQGAVEVFSLRTVHTEAKSVVGLDGRAAMLGGLSKTPPPSFEDPQGAVEVFSLRTNSRPPPEKSSPLLAKMAKPPWKQRFPLVSPRSVHVRCVSVKLLSPTDPRESNSNIYMQIHHQMAPKCRSRDINIGRFLNLTNQIRAGLNWTNRKFVVGY